MSRKRLMTARTGRNWLHQLGLSHRRFAKGVYVDGHEREDVVAYRNTVFIPFWLQCRQRLVTFEPDGKWSKPQNLPVGIKPLVIVTHDESTFNANDGRRQGWVYQNHQPLLPKGRGKGIMVSAFLTPGGILKVPDSITDEELLRMHHSWPCRVNRVGQAQPVRDAVELLEYGKDNYWDGDKMVDQTIKHAVPIFELAFPGCQGLFAFDNAANHCAFAPDALVASKMNLNPGGAQSKMRDTIDHSRNLAQSMVFANDDLSVQEGWRGKPKGAKIILQERGLWSDYRQDGTRFLFSCGKKGCETRGNLKDKCCASALLASLPDFQQQKGRLEEELNREGHIPVFYPKFHCEVNFIERFWCSAKRYARENCQYSLIELRKTVPMALHSVPTETILRYHQHCERIIDAYAFGLPYGTKMFTERVYRGHRGVQDKTKW